MALPPLRRSGGGAIVNVASIAGRLPLKDEATYSAVKFALRTFTFALTEELRGSGIMVSAVSPGPVDTNFIMETIDEVPDIVFAQPMSSAEDIAEMILACAHDGKTERVRPAVSGVMATAAYLMPPLRTALSPVMALRGRLAKRRYRDRAMTR